ncbi:MAG: hypothetical protein WBD81_21875 [Collimonas pratensis]|uniref:hypothetical protein n=1 Tax=Collimonas pratensis TaxID=279113 RepID=UPI003C7657DD
MKKILVAVFALMFTVPALARSSGHSSNRRTDASLSSVGPTSTGSRITHVKGYTKRDGTHVNAYDRTSKDDTKADNWSAKGNINPETGKPGAK